MIRKQSFISNLFGYQGYREFKNWAKIIVPIGAGIFVLLYILSSFFHSNIIKVLLDITNGSSLLFLVFVSFLVVLLDIEVDVDEPENNYWNEEKKESKPLKYKLTILWAVFLFLLGILAIYYSNRFKKQYIFECETFLVDEKAGIYHLDLDIDCEAANEAEVLEVMKGYQIDKTYKFCEGCKEWLEDSEYEGGLVHARP
jgi:hypothetical protein